MKTRLAKPCRTPPLANRSLLERILRRIPRLAGLASPATRDCEIAFVLVDRPAIRQLNRDFLAHEGDTDVIAFDYRPPGEDGGGAEAVADSRTAAEVFVCLPVAVDAATRHRTSVSFEVLLYSIHGALHLAGFDDHCVEDRRRMRAEERRLLSLIESEFGTLDVFEEQAQKVG